MQAKRSIQLRAAGTLMQDVTLPALSKAAAYLTSPFNIDAMQSGVQGSRSQCWHEVRKGQGLAQAWYLQSLSC